VKQVRRSKRGAFAKLGMFSSGSEDIVSSSEDESNEEYGDDVQAPWPHNVNDTEESQSLSMLSRIVSKLPRHLREQALIEDDVLSTLCRVEEMVLGVAQDLDQMEQHAAEMEEELDDESARRTSLEVQLLEVDEKIAELKAGAFAVVHEGNKAVSETDAMGTKALERAHEVEHTWSEVESCTEELNALQDAQAELEEELAGLRSAVQA